MIQMGLGKKDSPRDVGVLNFIIFGEGGENLGFLSRGFRIAENRRRPLKPVLPSSTTQTEPQQNLALSCVSVKKWRLLRLADLGCFNFIFRVEKLPVNGVLFSQPGAVCFSMFDWRSVSRLPMKTLTPPDNGRASCRISEHCNNADNTVRWD